MIGLSQMHKEWYPSNRVVKAVGNVLQHHFNTPADEARAKRLGITVAELNHRENIIRKEVNRLSFKIRQVLYPAKWQDYQTYGRVVLEAVAYNTIQYGDARWSDTQPQILLVSLENERNKRLDCSIDWLSETAPVEESTC